MAKVYFLLGGNLGNRYQILKKATNRMEEELGKLIAQSSFYETEPWGFEHEQHFLNQVLEMETFLCPEDVLQKTQAIEKELGRIRSGQQYSERTIDIDILLFDDLIMNNEDLIIPHPRISERMFALAPLVEIAGQMVHPGLQKTMIQLQQDCPDKMQVVRIDSEERK